jgi:hypothetical protein
MWRLCCGLAESEFDSNLEWGGRFCVGGVSVAVNLFSHLIWFVKGFYTFYTFNTICKDDAKNYNAVQYKSLIPVNFEGSQNASLIHLFDY